MLPVKLVTPRKTFSFLTLLCRNLNFKKSIEDVYVLGVARTPLGSFQKSLSALSAPILGGVAIKGAVNRAKIDPNSVQECYMGLVVSAFTKQAPAKQAALLGGLSLSTPCTTVNKVCASGMKAIMIASQSIALGVQDVICAGGMESMSNIPFYLPRQMPPYGGATLYDAIVYDGLLDAKYQIHMGRCAEKTAKDLGISREEQDDYAKLSYERSQAASSAGIFTQEIVPVQVPDRKALTGFVEVGEDEEYKRVNFTRFPQLKPAFLSPEEGGTVTAANASTLNDGAAATILASGSFVGKHGSVKPLGKVLAFADAATDTIDFAVAPHLAIQKLLSSVGLKTTDIALWEINEAFSVVALANIRLLGIPLEKVNIHGGAVSCGHPIGMSGARITNHLLLSLKPGQMGIASVCNGGGGASAILVERI